MAVTTAYSTLEFNGNGATTAFAVSWQFYSGSLVVTAIDADGVETVKTISTHYTVSGGTTSEGLSATGTVTMLTAPASGTKLRITRNTSKTQAVTWVEGDPFPAKVAEAAFDRLTLIAQENSVGGSANNGITGDVLSLNSAGATDYWDGEDQILRNLADPVNATDAVTKAYGDANYGGTAATSAAASAATALAAKTAAETAETNAETAETNAEAAAAAAAADAATVAASLPRWRESSTTPAGPHRTLDHWLDTDDGAVRIYSGSAYVQVSTPADLEASASTKPTIVSTISALKALDRTKHTVAILTASGRSGAFGWQLGDYSALVAIDTLDGIYVKANDTAASVGCWVRLDARSVDIRWFGAVADGTTDNGPAIRLALNFTTYGGTLVIPPGRWGIGQDASNAWCLRLNKPVSIVGGGQYASIVPISSVGTSVDTIKVAVDDQYDWTSFKIEGLGIGDPNTGTRNGRYGIYIDTTATGVWIAKFRIIGCSIWHGADAAINHTNGSNANGGYYGSSITDNVLEGGIELVGSGDSIVVSGNIISGGGIGVDATLVDGASLIDIEKNNITSTGGGVVIRLAMNPRIRDNNIEQTTTGALDNAMINLKGDAGTIRNPIVEGNHCGAFTGSGITSIIKVNNCIGGRYNGNLGLPASASTKFATVSNSLRSVFGSNTVGDPMVPPSIEETTASQTIGAIFALTLTSPWTAKGGTYRAPGYMLSEDGTVRLFGAVEGGTVGQTIATLPAGYRPAGMIRLPHVATQTSPFRANIRIDTNGDIVASSDTDGSLMVLDGVSFAVEWLSSAQVV